ncbi:MAG TPA: ABC transporter permease [Bryobacteraceae bacterium]|nr:ABC transporter permease [Bryobacteraceae bacterium]
MGNLYQDLRYAVRTLRRSPGFTLIAILTLGLGIGANTAIFSLVHAVILKPLPFHDPARLVAIWDTYLPQFPKVGISPPEMAAWQQQTDLFEQTAWYRYVPQNLALTSSGAEPLEVHAGFASATLLPTLGVAPAIGHAFASTEPPNSLLLGDALWRTRFGGDPSILGKSIRLNEREFTIVGVMAPEFRFPEWADLWLPQGPLQGDELTNPVRHALGFVARLRPSATPAQAGARIRDIAQRLAAEHPKTSTGWGVKLVDLQEDLTANLRPSLWMLLGAVTLVLLIACGNMANLLLSRSTSRAREIAVRTALGAGSARLVRQLLVESVLLAAAGGTFGLVLASVSLAAAAPVPAPLDSSVLLFLLAISTATGVLCGLAPALQTLRADTNSIIKSASQASGRSPNVRGTLVVLEFALALILVAGAGILLKSFERLMHVDPGFSPQGVVTVRLSIPPSRKPNDLFHRIDARLRTLPGVQSIAASNTLPLIANRANTTRFNVPGSPLVNPDALPAAQIRAVSPDYFQAMHIPIRSGRAFTERDLNDPVAIINESMAKRFWPGEDPVGRKFITGPWSANPSFSTIIGVAGDVKNFGLDSESTMDLYFPSLNPAYVVVKSSGDAAALAGAVRREIHAADPDLPLSDLQTMDEILANSAHSRRWTMALLAVFAGLALLLALIGIYGVMSWLVAQRTREIGIRMALGASRAQVLGLVIRYGFALSGIGTAIGVAGALALRRVLSGLVFDVSTADPWIYGGVVLLMLAVALLACYVPARRAARVDPLIALRWE